VFESISGYTDYSTILTTYLAIIGFRCDSVAVSTLTNCDEPSRYFYIVRLQRYKLVQHI